MSKINQIRDRIFQVLNTEFKGIEANVLVFIEDQESAVIGGNACPVCTAETIMGWVIDEQIKHKEDQLPTKEIH